MVYLSAEPQLLCSTTICTSNTSLCCPYLTPECRKIFLSQELVDQLQIPVVSLTHLMSVAALTGQPLTTIHKTGRLHFVIFGNHHEQGEFFFPPLLFMWSLGTPGSWYPTSLLKHYTIKGPFHLTDHTIVPLISFLGRHCLLADYTTCLTQRSQ